MMYADVILPLPLDSLFTYSVPAQMEGQVSRGMRVLVPFGRGKSYVGIVARLHDVKPEGYEVKSIAQVMDSDPILLESQLRLWEWISKYYMSPMGDVLKAAIPSGLKLEDGYKPRTETYIRLTQPFRQENALHAALDKLARAPRQQVAFMAYLQLSHWDTIEGSETAEAVQEITREELMNNSEATLPTLNQLVKRGLLETYELEVSRLNREGEPHSELIKKMTAAQQDAYNQILFSFMKKPVVLLHGVTGSGKTEVYIHLIQREIDEHRQVLYLLPEIALTVQIMDRLHRIFGNRLGIYHSKYSDAERVEIWQKQLSGHPYDIILGARSAVFLPFQRLGLIIVDEEHETSFKQQDPAPRYHARDVAVMMAMQMRNENSGKDGDKSMASFPRVLLGTATPSIESYHNALPSRPLSEGQPVGDGKYGLVELSERYQGMELPEIKVVDTQDLQRRKMMSGPFSPLLLARVREALDSGEQAILFQNRRGWAPMVECRQCGWVPRCEHCDVSLTLHRHTNQLSCHYCGYTYNLPSECPACGSKDLRGCGYGTEKIEDQIRLLFPMARISRMDLDTTRTRQAYERIISDFSAGRTNLLIGTQMISKGLDFDKVSVVGILNADSMLSYPDFRAYEHAFMMMTQVSGRAGRKGRRGLVVLQTRQPQLEIIGQVVSGNYQDFYRSTVSERLAFHYPPFYRIITIYLKHRSDAVVSRAADEMGVHLRQLFGSRVLGPDKPSVARVKMLSIRQLLLKLERGIDQTRVRQCLKSIQQHMLQDKRYASLQLYYDVDPL